MTESRRIIQDFYVIDETPFKSGSFSDIYKGKSKTNGKKVAIKKIKKEMEYIELISNEVTAYNKIKHKNVIKFIDFFKSDFFYMVFEFIDSIDLLEYVCNYSPIRISTVKKIFVQLLKAIKACYKNDIIHRDIKLENIIIKEKSKKIYLIDFGLCSLFQKKGELIRTFSGSHNYFSPEVMERIPHCPFKSEIWSLGIVLFGLAFGVFPSFAYNRVIRKRQPIFPKCCYEDKKYEKLKHLLSKMLLDNPNERIEFKDILCHEWIK